MYSNRMRTRIWFKVRDRVPFIDERWMFRVGYIKDIQINEYIEQPIIKIDVEEGREKYVFPESILRIYMSEFIDNFKLLDKKNFLSCFWQVLLILRINLSSYSVS